jgi:general secretion pathway protein C
MPARLSAFLIWAMVAASVTFWGLRFFVTAPAAPAHTLLVADSSPARVDLTRLLGAPPVAAVASVVAPAISSRFQLTGVMAPKVPGADGIALIAVDGKMPRAFRVGAPIDGELVLQSVSLRSAAIGPVSGAPAVVLELPVLPAPATGSLSSMATMSPPAATAPAAPAARPPAAAPVPPPARAQVPQRRLRGMGTPPGDANQQPANQQ